MPLRCAKDYYVEFFYLLTHLYTLEIWQHNLERMLPNGTKLLLIPSK